MGKDCQKIRIMFGKRKIIISASKFSSGHFPANAKIVLLFVGIIIFIVIVGIFIGHRQVSNKNGDETEIPDDSNDASLSMKRVRQTASRNGVAEWRLDAESAQYFKNPGRAVFTNPSIVFFRKNGPEAKLSARHGVLDTSSNNIEAKGAVTVSTEKYTLKTEKLGYNHKKKIITSMGPAKVFKDESLIEADKIKIDLKIDRTLFEGNVNCALKTKKNNSEKIYVVSRTLTADHAAGYAEFSGNVGISGKNFSVSANRARIYEKKDPDKKGLTLTEESIDKIKASGNVHIKFDNRVAMSDEAIYIIKDGLLVLTGENATLASGEDKVSGTRIALDRKRGNIKIEGDGKKRVKAVFYPGERRIKH